MGSESTSATGPPDFFISYTEADRAWAEWIAVELEQARYSVIVQAFDFRPASDFLRQMENALDTAQRMIAVVSPGYFSSAYCMFEWRAAIAKDLSGDDRYLLPIRTQDFALPTAYQTRVYVDLTGHAEAVARRKLLAAAQLHRPHPASRPYPGGPPRRPRYPAAGPETANLPARNAHFTGRDTTLTDLHDRLHAQHRAAIVPTSAIHGLGGIGKTQTALEYAHRYATDYDIVWWIDAEKRATAIADVAALAEELGLADPADQTRSVKEVLRALRERDRWLLVYDNAEDPDLLAGLLPAAGGGHVLITSRWADWTDLGSSLPLSVLSRTEAIQLLRHRVDPTDPVRDDTAWGQLAELLGDLPLALTEAAAYLRNTGLDLTAYIELVRQRSQDLFGYPNPATAAPGADRDRRRVATVWSLSLDHIHDKAPAAELLLNLLAFLAPETPRMLLPDHPHVLPDELATIARDPLVYNDTLATLSNYSLATLTSTTVSLHRLVQTVIRARCDQNQAASYARASLALIHAAFPTGSKEVEHWAECERLLPQLLTVTEHAQQDIAGSIETADLLERATGYLESRGQYRAAEPLAKHAIHVTQAALDPLDDRIAAAHDRYGNVLRSLGDYPNARAQMEQAIRLTEAAHGPDHVDLARWHTHLGGVFNDLRDFNAARLQHEEAIRIGDLTLGQDHRSSGIFRINLGGALTSLGDLEAARVQIENAIEIGETAYGPNHPEMARWRNNLASLYRDLGDLDAAREEYEHVIQITQATLGPDHPDMAKWRSNLGSILLARGDLAASLEQYEQAIRVGEATLGPDHPDMAIKRNGLGEVLFALGELQGAHVEHEKAIRITDATLGAHHPLMAYWRGDLGKVLRARGELPAARGEYEAAIRIGEATLGPDHKHLAHWHFYLGLILANLGDYPAARGEYEAAIRITETTHGPDHPDMGAMRNNLGLVLAALGDHPAARTEYETAIHIIETTYGPDHPDLARWHNNLGATMLRLRDYTAARTELEAAIRIQEATHGPDHTDLASWRNNLGLVLHALGDLSAARSEHEAAIRIGETILGPDHPDLAGWHNNLGLVLETLGDSAGARIQYQAAIRIAEATLPSDHPDLSNWRRNLIDLRASHTPDDSEQPA